MPKNKNNIKKFVKLRNETMMLIIFGNDKKFNKGRELAKKYKKEFEWIRIEGLRRIEMGLTELT